MNNQELEKVLDRIQKLLAMAEHERSDPQEAAVAAAMAEKLMRKYQLDRSDIIIETLQAGEDLDTVDVVASGKTNGTRVARVPLWAQWIAVQVAAFTDTGVRIVNRRYGEDSSLRFYGYTGDIQVARYMMDYLVGVTNRLCAEFRDTPEYAYHGAISSPRRAMDSYRKGAAQGIADALRAAIRAKKAEQVSTGTALVVVKQQAIADKYGDFGTKRSKSSVSSDAYDAGVRDGRKVDVTRSGITHAGTANRRIAS